MSLETKEYAKRLVEQMTLEEKISQMRYESPAIERLHIPAYNWWNEALHGVARSGVATMFPQAIALAATFDEELIEKIGDVVSTEGRAKFEAYSGRGDRGIYKGLTFWAPNINIFRDKTTPRLIQFHTLKNAVNPPFLGGFSIFNTVVA